MPKRKKYWYKEPAAWNAYWNTWYNTNKVAVRKRRNERNRVLTYPEQAIRDKIRELIDVERLKLMKHIEEFEAAKDKIIRDSWPYKYTRYSRKRR